MAEISDHDIITAMQSHGGSFVRHLAQAYVHADEMNQIRLRTAFRDYWEEYDEIARLTAKEAARHG